ncbi:MAG TPA: shikimate kinase [Acidimicrobiales bacterium]
MTPSSARSPDRIFLVGMMGAGKTTVGQLLADELGWRYVDSDREVVATTGRTVREIFETDGEAAFRAMETAVLEHAVAGDEPAVVGVAGGAVLDAANRETLRRSGTVVWLKAPLAALAARIGGADHRPLLGDDPAAALARLYPDREPLYEGLADVIVDVATRTPGEVVAEIRKQLGR